MTSNNVTEPEHEETKRMFLSLSLGTNHTHSWKLNWNELVEKTSTRMLNAREYHMIWRCVACAHRLIDVILKMVLHFWMMIVTWICKREALPPH